MDPKTRVDPNVTAYLCSCLQHVIFRVHYVLKSVKLHFLHFRYLLSFACRSRAAFAAFFALRFLHLQPSAVFSNLSDGKCWVNAATSAMKERVLTLPVDFQSLPCARGTTMVKGLAGGSCAW